MLGKVYLKVLSKWLLVKNDIAFIECHSGSLVIGFQWCQKGGNYIMWIDICIVCHHQKGGNSWGMRKHEVCSFDGWQRVVVLMTKKKSWYVTNVRFYLS